MTLWGIIRYMRSEVNSFNEDTNGYDVVVFSAIELSAVLLSIREVQSLNLSAKYTNNFSASLSDSPNKLWDIISLCIFMSYVSIPFHQIFALLRSYAALIVTDVSGTPLRSYLL